MVLLSLARNLWVDGAQTSVIAPCPGNPRQYTISAGHLLEAGYLQSPKQKTFLWITIRCMLPIGSLVDPSGQASVFLSVSLALKHWAISHAQFQSSVNILLPEIYELVIGPGPPSWNFSLSHELDAFVFKSITKSTWLWHTVLPVLIHFVILFCLRQGLIVYLRLNSN